MDSLLALCLVIGIAVVYLTLAWLLINFHSSDGEKPGKGHEEANLNRALRAAPPVSSISQRSPRATKSAHAHPRRQAFLGTNLIEFEPGCDQAEAPLRTISSQIDEKHRSYGNNYLRNKKEQVKGLPDAEKRLTDTDASREPIPSENNENLPPPGRCCEHCEKERVMFLPDRRKPCPSFIYGLKNNLLSARLPSCPKYGPNCDNYHGSPGEGECALAELLKSLNETIRMIYLCMFSFTNKHLSDFLRFLKQRNVIIQILVDDQAVKQEHGQIAGLLEDDFEVRFMKDDPLAQTHNKLMHNKYCIIDKRTMISGSPNWTNSAFTRNNEMIQWTENPRTVAKVAEKFETLFASAQKCDKPNEANASAFDSEFASHSPVEMN